MRIRLGSPMTAQEIVSHLDGAIRGIEGERLINHLTTDSREAEPGDLFIALRGTHYNGADYAQSAADAGAIPLSDFPLSHGITVEDTSASLLRLAAYAKTRLRRLKYTVAITGSVGKTTTKEFLGLISESKYRTHITKGNHNNHIGLPLTLLEAPSDTEALILEMGMNHAGEISALSRCAAPDIAIITNVGTAHIGNLGSREMIAKAKLEILDGMSTPLVIIPENEPLLLNAPGALTFSVGTSGANLSIIKRANSRQIYILENGRVRGTAEFLPSEAHLLSCLAPAVLASTQMNIEINRISSAVSQISEQNLRQSLISCLDFYIYADYYNASLESLVAALSHLSGLSDYPERSALIGTVLELGGMSEEIHFEIGARCADYITNNLYFYGEHADIMREGAMSVGFPKEKIFINTCTELPKITAEQIIENRLPGEIILFKASRAIHLENVVRILKKL